MAQPANAWLEAEAAFLRGESAASIAGRLGLSLAAVRKRIERGGWAARRDLGHTQPLPRRVKKELSRLSRRLANLSELVGTT